MPIAVDSLQGHCFDSLVLSIPHKHRILLIYRVLPGFQSEIRSSDKHEAAYALFVHKVQVQNKHRNLHSFLPTSNGVLDRYL